MSSYRERKAQRRDYYLRFVYGWKIRPCTACSGSGHYDGEGAPVWGVRGHRHGAVPGAEVPEGLNDGPERLEGQGPEPPS